MIGFCRYMSFYTLHSTRWEGEAPEEPPPPTLHARVAVVFGPIRICGRWAILGLGDGSWIFAMALPQNKSNQKCPASRSPPLPAAPQVHSWGVANFSFYF